MIFRLISFTILFVVSGYSSADDGIMGKTFSFNFDLNKGLAQLTGNNSGESSDAIASNAIDYKARASITKLAYEDVVGQCDVKNIPAGMMPLRLGKNSVEENRGQGVIDYRANEIETTNQIESLQGCEILYLFLAKDPSRPKMKLQEVRSCSVAEYEAKGKELGTNQKFPQNSFEQEKVYDTYSKMMNERIARLRKANTFCYSTENLQIARYNIDTKTTGVIDKLYGNTLGNWKDERKPMGYKRISGHGYKIVTHIKDGYQIGSQSGLDDWGGVLNDMREHFIITHPDNLVRVSSNSAGLKLPESEARNIEDGIQGVGVSKIYLKYEGFYDNKGSYTGSSGRQFAVRLKTTRIEIPYKSHDKLHNLIYTGDIY